MSDDIQLNDPQTLYERWEGAQWNPFTVPLEPDREQWAEMDEADRGLVYWVLSSLMVAEERITTKFSGLVGAHGSEEEASFLATQQVDEARHIGYGVWFLRESVREFPEVAPDAVREMLRKLLPSVAESLSPSSEPGGPDRDALGVSGDEIREFALGGLTRRLEIVGVPLESVF